jgi:Mesyanzhinovviridae DNA helicase
MKTPQWKHQATEFEACKDLDARALLWSMRTGKSKQVVDTACYRHEVRGDVEGVLVLAPNGVHLNWTRNEVPKHSWGESVAVPWSSAKSVRGSRETRDDFDRSVARLLYAPRRDGLKWLTVNSEALILPRVQKLIKEFRASIDGRGLLVVDECQDFRRPGARRTFLARGLRPYWPVRRILSGTAVLNSPLHAFSEYEILEKGALGYDRFEDFKRRYAVFMRQRLRSTGRGYLRLDHYKNLEELRARMGEFSSVVLREDVEDMPTLLTIERPVVMSDAQVLAYREMVERLILDIDGGRVTATEGGKRFMKLHQLVGGFVIDDHGDVVSVDDSPPILDALVEQVEGTLPGKCVVWCRFREDIRRVCARLRSLGYDVVEFHGGVRDSLREEGLARFLGDERSADVLVGQPQAGGVGRDMSAADAIIWYSSVPDAIYTNQAMERATAVGGKTVAVITLSTPGTVHDDIAASNAGKFALADTVAGRGLRDLLAKTSV